MRSEDRKSVKEKRFLGRPAGLLGVVLVMSVLIFGFGEKWRHSQGNLTEQATFDPGKALAMVLEEGRMYAPPVIATSFDHRVAEGENPRTLADVYSLRHYPGSPPRIPHEVDPDIARTMNCAVCHEKGGFVQKYNAYAPITPHPEYANCMQCHVPQQTESLFRANDFVSLPPPALHRAALPGGPPPIPHDLQLREDCLACHGGPAAPLEIRTTHPERINCRQCHVPVTATVPFLPFIHAEVSDSTARDP